MNKSIGDFSRLDNVNIQSNWIEMLRYFDQLPSLTQWRENSIMKLQLKDSDIILDAGCGMGGATNLFAKHLSRPGKIIGVDLSRDLINIARKNNNNNSLVDFQVEDITKLSFSEDYFDIARCDRVLHHVSTPIIALKEIHRVLKKSGRVIFSEPDFSMWRCYPLPEDLTEVIARKFIHAAAHARIGIQLVKLLTQLKFKVLEVQQYGIIINNYSDLERYFSISSLLLQSNVSQERLTKVIGRYENSRCFWLFYKRFPSVFSSC